MRKGAEAFAAAWAKAMSRNVWLPFGGFLGAEPIAGGSGIAVSSFIFVRLPAFPSSRERTSVPGGLSGPFEILAEDLSFVGQALGDDARDARDVEEVAIVHVVGKAVLPPGAAAHREREGKPVVEAAAGRDAMGLIDDDARDGKLQGELGRLVRIARMQADGMAGALIGIDVLDDAHRLGEGFGAVDRQHGR